MRTSRILIFLLVAACGTASRHAAENIRVLVFNIHAGKDAGGIDNLERVAGLIRDTDADLVLLQEVDRRTRRSDGVDHFAWLRDHAGLHGAYGKSLDFQDGEYGIAILSRWPVETLEVAPLRVDPPQERAGGSIEPRVALVVSTNGTTVINTHLDASPADTYRLQEVATLAQLAERYRGALILGGDLNSTPDSPVHRYLRAQGLRDAWFDCGSGQELTYPAATPVKRIDYLLLSSSFQCTSARVLESSASDHRPVLFTIQARD